MIRKAWWSVFVILYSGCFASLDIDCDVDWEQTEPHCSVVYETECQQVKKKKCEDIIVPRCVMEPEEKCATELVHQCKTEMKEKCIKETVLECNVTPDVDCKTTSVCDLVYEKVCSVINRRVCPYDSPIAQKKPTTLKNKKARRKRETETESTSSLDKLKHMSVKTLLKKCHELAHLMKKNSNRELHKENLDDRRHFLTGNSNRFEGKVVKRSIGLKIPRNKLNRAGTENIKIELSRQKRFISESILSLLGADEGCEDVPVEDCINVPVEKCHDIQKCEHKNHTICEDVLFDKCWDEPEEHCWEEPVEKCGFEDVERCWDESVENCTDELVDVCHEIPKKKCDEEMIHVAREQCEKKKRRKRESGPRFDRTVKFLTNLLVSQGLSTDNERPPPPV